jgi:hypothetical protein
LQAAVLQVEGAQPGAVWLEEVPPEVPLEVALAEVRPEAGRLGLAAD